MKIRILALLALSSVLVACGGPPAAKSTVTGFLDAVIANRPYSQYVKTAAQLGAIIAYVPLSYEVKNVSNDTVSVLITFRGKNGQYHDVDMLETRLFHLQNGQISSIE